MSNRVLASAVLAMTAAACLEPAPGSREQGMVQQHQTGFVPQTIDFDGRTYRYSVFVPDSYTPERAWPTILFLHGAGERGQDGTSHTMVGLGKAIRAQPERFECLVVMPQCPADRRWEGSMQELALATLDATEAKYKVDPDRIALTGLSLGGYGTWSIGARWPERFCALLPICGGGDPAHAEQLATVPIWCFHGAADPVVDVERSREMVSAVRSAGGRIEYSELPGVTHNSWDSAYGDPRVIAWMLAQRRHELD